jgi:predicted Zn-dependent protease
VGGVLAIYLLLALFFHDFAPETGRFRVIIMPGWLEKKLAAATAESMRQQSTVLPATHPYSLMAIRVAKRLRKMGNVAGKRIPPLKITVIVDPSPNAGVLPDGSTFVNTGLFEQGIVTNDDELAAVLSHEVAHVVARHSAENISTSALVLVGGSLILNTDISNLRAAYQLLLGLPFSRKMESEADHIGLLLMSRACYEPRAALTIWQRFKAQPGARPPAFLSTHPAPENRLERIKELLPEADKAAEACPLHRH